MTNTLDLPETLERKLVAEASRRRMPIEEYALRVLSGEDTAEQVPKSGAELVDYWRGEGLIGSRPEILDSVAHARQIRRKAEERFRA